MQLSTSAKHLHQSVLPVQPVRCAAYTHVLRQSPVEAAIMGHLSRGGTWAAVTSRGEAGPLAAGVLQLGQVGPPGLQGVLLVLLLAEGSAIDSPAQCSQPHHLRLCLLI